MKQLSFYLSNSTYSIAQMLFQTFQADGAWGRRRQWRLRWKGRKAPNHISACSATLKCCFPTVRKRNPRMNSRIMLRIPKQAFPVSQ